MRHILKEKFDHKDLNINIDYEKKRLKQLKHISNLSTIESLKMMRSRMHFFQLYRSFDHQENQKQLVQKHNKEIVILKKRAHAFEQLMKRMNKKKSEQTVNP